MASELNVGSLETSGDVTVGEHIEMSNGYKVRWNAGTTAVEGNGNTLKLRTSSSDQLTIDSAGLATFSAGINLGSTDLSSYEEGTFTPTITGGSVAGSHSSIIRIGDYVRVGNICTVSGLFSAVSGTGSGDMILGGLPFSVSSATVAVGNIQANSGAIFAAGTLPSWIGAGGTTFKMRQTFLDGSAFTYAAYPTDPSYLRFTITYITA